MFFVPVAAPAYYPGRAGRGPVFSPVELLDDGLLVSPYGLGHAARHDFPAFVANRELAELQAILFAQQRHTMVEEQRRHELARRVQEIEEHERWVQHQLALRARREQLIRARREKMVEDQRRRQHAEAERALIRTLLFAHELAKHVQTEAEKPQPRVRFAPCHVGPAQPSTVPATSRPTVPPNPVLKNSPIPTSSTTSTQHTRVPIRSSSSNVSPAASTPSTSAPIRIPIRESKGKTSSHVRVTSHIPEPLPAGDAIAALSLLEADLDAISLGAGPAVMKHQLTRLLEQVDAVESNGHEAVRDVRRALVQRIESALEALDSGNAVDMESPKEAGITIREAKAVRTPSPAPVPYVVDELLKPAPPEPTSSSPETAVSAPAPESYVVDDFLVASSAPVAPVVETPAPEGDVDPVQHFDDSTVPVESVAMDDFAAPPQASDEPTKDVEVDGTVNPQQSSNDVEPSISLPPATSDVADIAPISASASSVQDAARTPAPVERVTPVENDGEPAAVAPTTAAAVDATAAPASSPTQLATSYPPAQLFDTPTHPAIPTSSPVTRAAEASDVGSDWESTRGSGSDGEEAFEVLSEREV